ncbi:hypothetical protein CCUS01_12256 [Colletotrichum cuscutae]|uniref:Uncharacterized protein n=1 Tax=Colletotrichum cuscutae TaxID=1209917 RepID=A0AAI9TVG5_9PEZI|nr:hypothetical protein CCUS01_12256 [Colletotrichum cuscutae]
MRRRCGIYFEWTHFYSGGPVFESGSGRPLFPYFLSISLVYSGPPLNSKFD